GEGRPALAIIAIRLAGHTDGIQASIELNATLGVRSIFASASLARVMHIMTQTVVRCWKAKFGYRSVHASSDGG
ncbi:hypothetical protein ACC862_38295, partial [Rhizobium ruizarguesonis]